MAVHALKVLVNEKLRSAPIVSQFHDINCTQIVSFLSSAEINGGLQLYNTGSSITQATFISLYNR